MKQLIATEFQYKRYLIHSALFGAAGFSVGLASALMRPYAQIGPTHYEALVEFFVLMPLLCLGMTLLFIRVPFRQAAPAIIGQLTLLWLANIAGRILAGLIREPMIDDFFGLIVAFWLGSAVAAVLLLGLIRKAWPLQHASCDCPGCGYSLKGIGREGICPECGRPFTAEMLGVSAEDLSV